MSLPKAMQAGRGKGLGDRPFACDSLSRRFIYTIFSFDFCVFYGFESACYIPILTVIYTQQSKGGAEHAGLEKLENRKKDGL